MNATLLAALNDTERLLVAETEPAALAAVRDPPDGGAVGEPRAAARRHRSQVADPRPEARRRAEGVDRRPRGRRDADQHEAAEERWKAGEGVEQPREVLVRERVPREEEVRARHAELVERQIRGLRRRGGLEGRADAVRDHANPLGPGAEPLDQILARRLGDRDEPARPTHRQAEHHARVERRENVAMLDRKTAGE